MQKQLRQQPLVRLLLAKCLAEECCERSLSSMRREGTKENNDRAAIEPD
jgi:hypothetical protein